MTYGDQSGHAHPHGTSHGGSSRQYADGARPRITGQGSYHGPRGTQARKGGVGGRGARRDGGRDSYPLRSRPINFRGGRGQGRGSDRRLIILAALALVLVVLLVVGVSSCVRGCSSGPESSADTNPVDSRVAAGVSEDLTERLSAQLDQNEKLAHIAASASDYDDQGLLELALSCPEAIDFVAAYPEAEKTAQPYEDTVSQGTVPQLWCWDARWGSVDYAGRPLALTGSGPTALSMAYMGLVGNADKTPAELASLVSDAGLATGDSGMSASFLTSSAESLGLTCITYTSNADNLSHFLDTGTYLLVEAKANTLTDAAHWVLVVSENEDGSVVVYDPTSPAVSAHPWDPATVASSCDTLYALSATSTSTDATTE